MKRIVLALLAVCIACAGARAQDFLDRLKNKTKENIERKVENRIEQKVDSTVNTTVDNALDRLFNPNKKKTDKKAQEAPNDPHSVSAWNNPLSPPRSSRLCSYPKGR